MTPSRIAPVGWTSEYRPSLQVQLYYICFSCARSFRRSSPYPERSRPWKDSPQRYSESTFLCSWKTPIGLYTPLTLAALRSACRTGISRNCRFSSRE